MLAKLTLEDILTAKEQRKQRQDELRKQYGATLVSITVNMPGESKDSPLVRQLRDYAIEKVIKSLTVLSVRSVNLITGPEAILVVQETGQAAKEGCVNIETEHSFARLLDLDVFAADGAQISRRDTGIARTCLVCNQEAVCCMRERNHSKEELAQAVQRLLLEFSAQRTLMLTATATEVGALALEAMLYEVTCTPSPGLVDRMNSGAHQDMDFFTFMSSSAALSSYMARCAQAGINFGGEMPDLLTILRLIGIQGEGAMLKATSGVNTQKGLLFCLGIVAAAAGQLLEKGQSLTCDRVVAMTAGMTKGLVERELKYCCKPLAEQTAGERLYREHGITGIRGEMQAGLPTIAHYALPELKQALARGLSVNDALLQVLLVITMQIDDTTIMNRHDLHKMRVWTRAQTKKVLSMGGLYTPAGKTAMKNLDQIFITENISPGGAADLLAVTWFVYRLEQQFG